MIAQYINSKGDVLEFHTDNIWMTEQGFHTKKWSVDNDKVNISNKEVSCELVVRGTVKERANILNSIIDLLDYDLFTNQKGKLYIEDYYLECYPVESSTKNDSSFANRKTITLTFSGDGVWKREKKYVFTKDVSIKENEEEISKKYDYTYDYVYSRYNNNSYFLEPLTIDSDFKLVIYGAVNKPSIKIGQNTYEIDIEVYDNEYLVIDTNERTVKRVTQNGTHINVFDFRNKKTSIFKKISKGSNLISWSGMFTFDLILYENRSEPQWI